MELEYKFALNSAEQGHNILNDSALLPLSPRLLPPDDLSSCYYDTPDGALYAGGYALRLRTGNGGSVVTIKSRADAVNGLSDRQEWETRCCGLTDGLTRLAAMGCPAAYIAQSLAARLQIIAETIFTRYALLVDYNDSQIELASDIGRLANNGRTAPLCELELELKQGQQQDLLDLAGLISVKYNLQPLGSSKLERALRV